MCVNEDLKNRVILTSQHEFLRKELTGFIRSLSPAPGRIFVVVDTHTRDLCLPILDLHDWEDKITILEINPGEENKDINTCLGLWRQLSDGGADRHTLLILLGGGMLTDLGGFAASTFKRGLRFINMPTTLLAMVDAAVGGKTGINLDNIKNEVGCFAFPELTLIFPPFLNTLNTRQLHSGFAETIKHALIGDLDLWGHICLHHTRITGNSIESLTFKEMLISKSLEIKQNITAQDPYETGLRKVLNFGHTLGHAIESWSFSSKAPLLHGEAIALGMLAETWLSCRICGLDEEVLNDVRDLILSTYRLKPPGAEAWPRILDLMIHDKKNQENDLRFCLLEAVGKPRYDISVDPASVMEALAWMQQVYSHSQGMRS